MLLQRRRRARALGWALHSLSVWLLSACRPSGATEGALDDIATRGQAIEESFQGVYFDPAFVPAPSWSELRAELPEATATELARRLAWELAAQALPLSSSGSLTIPISADQPSPSTAVLRASCGATLIAPSWVVTAGHCAEAARKSSVTLQMYRPTAALAASYVKATQLSGRWPLFEAPALTAEDGYQLDEFPCEVVDSCFSPSLPASSFCSGTDDVGILRCEGRPGDRYGFVNLEYGESLSGREALVHWKHEVLDPAALPAPSEFDAHYRVYAPGQAMEDNYHYFAQPLLPLRSHLWGLDDPPRFLNERYVDVHGCHGTSGSGVLVRAGTTAEFRLTAPVSVGGVTLRNGTLCADAEDADSIDSFRGVEGLGIRWADPTSLLSRSAEARTADCRAREVTAGDVDELPFSPGTHRVATLFSHLDCQVSSFGHTGAPQPDAALGPYPEIFAAFAAEEGQEVEGFTLDADSDYRVALFSSESAPCAADCGQVTLEVAGQSLRVENRPAQSTTLISGFVHSEEEGPSAVVVTAQGTGRLLGGLTVLREGQVNSFDTPEDRLEAALYPLAEEAPRTPLPMRFVGDGRAGFAALLKRGERLGLLRQALVAGQAWTVRMESDSYEGLTCGLLSLSGEPLRAAPCAPLLRIDDAAGQEGRLGFYVELAAGAQSETAQVRYVALASGQARDVDQDGVPDVLDDCPDVADPAQEGCDAPLDAGAPRVDAGQTRDASLARDAGMFDAGMIERADAGANDAGDAAAAPEDEDATSAVVEPDADAGEELPESEPEGPDSQDAGDTEDAEPTQPLSTDVSAVTAGEPKPRHHGHKCSVSAPGGNDRVSFAMLSALLLWFLRRRRSGPLRGAIIAVHAPGLGRKPSGR